MKEKEIRFDSYRDPAGFVFRENGRIYRAIRTAYETQYRRLISSGLAALLVEKGLLIPFEEVEPSEIAGPDLYKIIAPRQVPFVSYPWEWSFPQLRDAALATLQIQQIALEHGMTLKDASSLNIQFVDGRPTLIDTLSFECYEGGHPWTAYRQFCEQFLAPLALSSRIDDRLMSASQATGGTISLDFAVRLLGLRRVLRPGLFLHLYLQSKFQRGGKREAETDAESRYSVSEKALKGLVFGLEQTIKGLRPSSTVSKWSSYDPGSAGDPTYREAKQSLVASILMEVSPRSVWDIGCNGGIFSTMAAEAGARVVAIDQDRACISNLYRDLRASGRENILPLVIDIAFPTPATGWMNREHRSFLERGRCDLCLALALVHHLAIGRNLPFRNIIELFKDRCSFLLIEYVPKDDPNVVTMLRGRADVFSEYTQERFEAALSGAFVVARKTIIGSSRRILYLCRKTDSPTQ